MKAMLRSIQRLEVKPSRNSPANPMIVCFDDETLEQAIARTCGPAGLIETIVPTLIIRFIDPEPSEPLPP